MEGMEVAMAVPQLPKGMAVDTRTIEVRLT